MIWKWTSQPFATKKNDEFKWSSIHFLLLLIPEPDLKKRIRVHLLNAHGLDEAGIDGGGIFREFLNELLKSGFNPNQGFFKTTNDSLLYPSPAAEMLVGDSFTRHYYFLGRLLGKVSVMLTSVFKHGGRLFTLRLVSCDGQNVSEISCSRGQGCIYYKCKFMSCFHVCSGGWHCSEKLPSLVYESVFWGWGCNSSRAPVLLINPVHNPLTALFFRSSPPVIALFIRA